MILHLVVSSALVKTKTVSLVLRVELQLDYQFYDLACLLILPMTTFNKLQTMGSPIQLHLTYVNEYQYIWSFVH